MQARGIAQLRIPPLAHACVAACQHCTCYRGHLPTPQLPEWALCTWAPGLRCQLAAPLPSPLPVPLRDPFFCLWLVSWKSIVSPHPPQVLPLEIPRRTSGNQGLLPSSCSLYCLELRLVPALLHPPQALDAVQTSGTSSPKGSLRWPVEWAV